MDTWTLAERGLPVHGGLPVAVAERLTGVQPCGHSGGWELTESWGKERGAPWGPHRGRRGDRARWEGNTGADGASRCEEWEGSVETVL
jgi:hypothetical protein